MAGRWEVLGGDDGGFGFGRGWVGGGEEDEEEWERGGGGGSHCWDEDGGRSTGFEVWVFERGSDVIVRGWMDYSAVRSVIPSR